MIDPEILKRLEHLASLIRQIQGALGGMRIVAGTVTSAGAVNTGSGFTAAKNSTGDYTVTFTDAFADAPAVVVTPITGAKAATISASSESAFTAVLFTTTTGGNADTAFEFVAIGPA